MIRIALARLVFGMVLLVAFGMAGCGANPLARQPTPTATRVPTRRPAATHTPTPVRSPRPSFTERPASIAGTALARKQSLAASATPKPRPTYDLSKPMPDARADPPAAIDYSAARVAASLRTAVFHIDFNMDFAPADEASAKALATYGAMPSALSIKGQGQGMLQVLDPSSGKADGQLELTLNVMGKSLEMKTVVISDTVWTRQGAGPWQRAPASSSQSAGLMNPAGWLRSFETGQKAEWVDDKPLDGQPARHLRLQMAPGKFDMAQLAQEEGDKFPLSGLGDIMSQMAVDMQGSTDVWLSAADLTPLQQRMTLGWDMSIPAGKTATPVPCTRRSS